MPQFLHEIRPFYCMYAIECENLVKTYPGSPPVHAVRGLNLTVRQGECFGLLGPNGAGKTTTIEILEGLLDPTSGDVRVLGLSWKDRENEIKQRIGISLQETRLLEKLTVSETVRLFRSMYRQGLSPSDAMQLVSIQGKANARVGSLSGGQKQRLAVACAIVGGPDLLFLDEPTTGLDPAARRELWEIIHQFRATGRTVLITTHYMDEAERLCDRIAIVDSGAIIAEGTPRELIASLGGEHLVHITLDYGSSPPAGLHHSLQVLNSVTSISSRDNEFTIAVRELHVALPLIMSEIANQGIPVLSLSSRPATLDDVFLKLAGRRIDPEFNE